MCSRELEAKALAKENKTGEGKLRALSKKKKKIATVRPRWDKGNAYVPNHRRAPKTQYGIVVG